MTEDIVLPIRCDKFLLGCGGRTLVLHMTPMEVILNDAIEFARRMQRTDQAVYWDGYLAGLMRAFFGRQAVSNSQHGALSAPDKTGGAASVYRDGYHKFAGCPGWTDLE